MVKRYYNAGKMYKKKGLMWNNCGTGPSSATYYPDATTLVKMELFGSSAGATVGVIDVCWYVSFKGWRA